MRGYLIRNEIDPAALPEDDFLMQSTHALENRYQQWKENFSLTLDCLYKRWGNPAQMFIVLPLSSVSSTNYRHMDEYTFDRLYTTAVSREYRYSPAVWPSNTGTRACIAASILHRKSFPLNWSLLPWLLFIPLPLHPLWWNLRRHETHKSEMKLPNFFLSLPPTFRQLRPFRGIHLLPAVQSYPILRAFASLRKRHLINTFSLLLTVTKR